MLWLPVQMVNHALADINASPSARSKAADIGPHTAFGERTRARVLLLSSCTGTCVSSYRVGQVLTVEYNPSGRLDCGRLTQPARPRIADGT